MCIYIFYCLLSYTGALNQILLLSFFAWPSCGYLANKQVITGSYLKHILDHYDTVLANQRASRYWVPVLTKPPDWLIPSHYVPNIMVAAFASQLFWGTFHCLTESAFA